MNAYINHSEPILWDTTFTPKKYATKAPQLTPVKTGAKVPTFILPKDLGIWQNVPAHFQSSRSPIQQLAANKPLVISFLAGGWNKYGLAHLQELKRAYQAILASGGNLLVIVNASYEATLEMVQHFEIPFNVLADPHQQIAEKFGLYSADVPVWERIAGISENVPVPATYLVDQFGKIIYHTIDEDFSRSFSLNDIKEALSKINYAVPYSYQYSLAA